MVRCYRCNNKIVCPVCLDYENIENPNNYEEVIEALHSNTANDDNHYMELERTQVNQQSTYETIILDRSGQNAAI